LQATYGEYKKKSINKNRTIPFPIVGETLFQRLFLLL